MVTKDFQTLNLKFDQVMFNNLVLTWERNFEVTFGIFSVLVFQISVLESYCCREPKRTTASIYALNAQFFRQKNVVQSQ